MSKTYQQITAGATQIKNAGTKQNTRQRIGEQFQDTIDYAKDVADRTADLEQEINGKENYTKFIKSVVQGSGESLIPYPINLPADTYTLRVTNNILAGRTMYLFRGDTQVTTKKIYDGSEIILEDSVDTIKFYYKASEATQSGDVVIEFVGTRNEGLREKVDKIAESAKITKII